MTRFFIVLLASVTLFMGTPALAHASGHGPCDGRAADIKPSYGRTVITKRVVQLVRCAVNRWPVSGGLSMALCIVDRESSFWPWAYNASGASGLFQQMDWANRVPYYLHRRWFPNHWQPGAFNARANVLLSIQMMHRGGLGPWGGGC